MKKLIPFLGLFLSTTLFISAQENTLSSGSEAIGTGGNVSYSVGQVGYTAQTGSNGSVSAGIQQSYSIITTLGEDLKTIQLNLSAYPNPVKDILTLDIEKLDKEQLTYFLIDINGRVIEEKHITKQKSVIKVDHLPKSIYFLNISDNQKFIKTFKIIKN